MVARCTTPIVYFGSLLSIPLTSQECPITELIDGKSWREIRNCYPLRAFDWLWPTQLRTPTRKFWYQSNHVHRTPATCWTTNPDQWLAVILNLLRWAWIHLNAIILDTTYTACGYHHITLDYLLTHSGKNGNSVLFSITQSRQVDGRSGRNGVCVALWFRKIKRAMYFQN